MNDSSTNSRRQLVRVWYATTSTEQPGDVEQTCERWLDPSEIDRANQFRRPTNRNQHVVGRGMARWLLGAEDVRPETIRFQEGINGKPYVVEPAEAKQPFNIAHTDGLVLCGVADPEIELVGVDIERECRQTTTELAERYFSKPEVEYVRAKPVEHQREAFLRVWTLKESFIKAIGTGLQTPLADFTFRDIDSGRPSIEMLNPDLETEHHWQFFTLRPSEGFIGAVAIACKEKNEDIGVDLLSFDAEISH